MKHEWSSDNYNGAPQSVVCLICSTVRTEGNAEEQCPRREKGPRPFPGSYLDDLDGFGRRLEELRSEREEAIKRTEDAS